MKVGVSRGRSSWQWSRKPSASTSGSRVRIGAQCAADESEGQVDISWDGVTAETNVSGQVDLLTNFITQGVDGLVYAATDAKVLYDVTKNAKDNGVTVVNVDSGTKPNRRMCPCSPRTTSPPPERSPTCWQRNSAKKAAMSPLSPSSRGP